MDGKEEEATDTRKRSHSPTENKDDLNVHSANKWEDADLGDDARKNKFLKLLGAGKKEHKGKIVIGEKDIHPHRESDINKIEKDLEEQFDLANKERIIGHTKEHRGLGHVESQHVINEPEDDPGDIMERKEMEKNGEEKDEKREEKDEKREEKEEKREGKEDKRGDKEEKRGDKEEKRERKDRKRGDKDEKREKNDEKRGDKEEKRERKDKRLDKDEKRGDKDEEKDRKRKG